MRLSVRLSVGFAVFGLAISSFTLLRQAAALREVTYARVEADAQVSLTAVRALVIAQAENGRFNELGRNLEQLVRRSGIASVAVEDASGRVLVRRADQTRTLDRTPHPGVPPAEVKDGVYDVSSKVALGRRGKGVVHVGFHLGPVELRLARLEGQLFSTGVMLILAVTLGAYLIGFWLGGNLERLVPRLEALSRDPAGFRPLAEDGPGEVGRLAAAFNRMGRSLKAETERRRELEAERRELSAMLVHDLKTPLTVVRSGVALLEDQLRSVKGAKRTFELLNMSAHRLQRMIEDVLQLSRMDEISELPKETVDLAALTRAAARDFEVVAADRKQSVHCDVPEGLALPVSGDPLLLRRVLDNLAHNAVEHTPTGGVITLSARADGGAARVEVSDSGPGIPPEARAEIFTKFFTKDLKRHVGNVGLGLALCEKVVSRHGGAIGVEDAAPKGARFYFMLPLSGAVPARPSAAVR